jgi:hypothetical protein
MYINLFTHLHSCIHIYIHRLRIEMMGMQGPDNREYYQERRLREMNLLRPLVCKI